MNYFIDVLKKYAVFSGRARRKEFWMYYLFYVIIGIALEIISFILTAITAAINNSVLTIIVSILSAVVILAFSLGTLVPTIAVTIRRLHDSGKSGWWYLIALVPLVGAIVLLVFCCLDSESGTNNYGPNPKEIM